MLREGLLGMALALGLTGCVAWGTMEVEPYGFDDDRGAVQVVSLSVGGKNFFVPSTIVVTAGSGRKLTLYNATDIPHGFQIPALGVELVLQPGIETAVDLPPLSGGHVYAVNCHVHPPHRGASLVVLPAK